MIELIDTQPDTEVQAAEYTRLLGYPRGWVLRDRARELGDWARGWYQAHGHPAVYARQAEALEISGGSIVIDGVPFSSSRLQRTLQHAGAHAVVLVAATAGPEIGQQAQALWEEGKPDEYFFLEVYGSAVVEHLVTMTGARLCASADRDGMAILPHYSPGYPEWPIEQQPRLLQLIKSMTANGGAAGQRTRPDLAVDVMDSGMLRPKKSLLAVFGVTRHLDRVQRLTDLSPCQQCSFLPCQFRRAPYLPAAGCGDDERESAADAAPLPSRAPAPLDRDGRYRVNGKALKRWSEERLSLSRQADGTIDALFRYEGTTCTNMGRPLEFHYRVKLGSRADGYPIRDQHCSPAEGDDGFTYMCRFLTNAEQLMGAIGHERPLHGRRLNDVLGWPRPDCSAACYCESDARLHKWGLVLETIHYALAREAE
jgi:hypothetical protein